MSDVEHPESEKKQELSLFLILTVVLAPILSISLIGFYGLFIWIFQILGGPPTN